MQLKECKLRKVMECDDNTPIVEVAKKLKENRERHIIVTKNKKPVGIISTTDISNRVVAENKNLKEVKAKEIMTSQILVKDINESAEKVYIEMIRENLFSIPIVEDGKLKGILDIKELMTNLVKHNIRI